MTLDEKFDLLLDKFGEIHNEMQDMKSEMQDMKSEMQDVKAEIKGMSERLDKVEDRLDVVENEMVKFNATLENVTNRNIKIIAEGHLDIMRKLDESLKVNAEKELLLIRVNLLENEVKQIKEKIAM